MACSASLCGKMKRLEGSAHLCRVWLLQRSRSLLEELKRKVVIRREWILSPGGGGGGSKFGMCGGERSSWRYTARSVGARSW